MASALADLWTARAGARRQCAVGELTEELDETGVPVIRVAEAERRQSIFPLPPPPSSAAGALERLRALGVGLHSAREMAGVAAAAAATGAAGAAGAAPAATAPAALPASAEIADLLAGGLPRGRLVEMVGGRSSGRFSAVLATLAAATAAGEAAALVDLGDGLDPQATEALGMDLRRLLWVRPPDLKQALACAEILLGGGFPLVALDLGSPPVRGGRGLEAAWVRLARAAQAHRAALLVASPYRVSGTAAAIVLQAARGRVLWRGAEDGGAPWLLDGLSCRLAVEKERGSSPAAHRVRRLELRQEDTILPAWTAAGGERPAAGAAVRADGAAGAVAAIVAAGAAGAATAAGATMAASGAGVAGSAAVAAGGARGAAAASRPVRRARRAG